MVGQSAPAPKNPFAGPSNYEVVSIRPQEDNGNGSRWWRPTPNGYKALNIELAHLVLKAYDIKFSYLLG